jgi:hypothetical protein
MIVHLVLFNPKPSVTSSQKRSFAKTMRACFEAVPEIRRVRVGKPTQVDPGYQRLFGVMTYQFVAILEFDSADGLISYLNHPTHTTLGSMFWEICESTIVSEHELIDGHSTNLEAFLLS